MKRAAFLFASALAGALAAPSALRADPSPAPSVSITVLVPSGQSLLCPVFTDGRMDGDLGAKLAEVADEVAIPVPASDRFTTLKHGEGRWRDEQGAAHTNVLPDGHGMVVTRRAAGEAHITFTGTPMARRCVIPEGRSIVGPAQAVEVPMEAPFARPRSGAVAASFDETRADVIAFLEPDGSWHRFFRTQDGKWFDVRTSVPATRAFRPGEACYYIRQPGQGPLVVDF